MDMESMILINEECKMFSMKSKDSNKKSAYGKKEVMAGLNTFLNNYNKQSNTLIKNSTAPTKEKAPQTNKSRSLAEAMNKLRQY